VHVFIEVFVFNASRSVIRNVISNVLLHMYCCIVYSINIFRGTVLSNGWGEWYPATF
jgi:hypothetical protein